MVLHSGTTSGSWRENAEACFIEWSCFCDSDSSFHLLTSFIFSKRWNTFICQARYTQATRGYPHCTAQVKTLDTFYIHLVYSTELTQVNSVLLFSRSSRSSRQQQQLFAMILWFLLSWSTAVFQVNWQQLLPGLVTMYIYLLTNLLQVYWIVFFTDNSSCTCSTQNNIYVLKHSQLSHLYKYATITIRPLAGFN